MLGGVYQHKHQLIFVFTNESTNEAIPESCRQWMRAIDDSLDEQVDEDEYTSASISELFQAIEKDKITPDERARMKDEYNQEEAKKQARDEGIKEGVERIARHLKASGKFTEEEIANMTG